MEFHEIGSIVRINRPNGVTIVKVEKAKAVFDKQFKQEFRLSCEGCAFARRIEYFCSGRPHWEFKCTAPTGFDMKCDSEVRDDNTFIIYKRVNKR